jgi:subtilisin family serine protease
MIKFDCYIISNRLTVGSTDSADERSSFSDYGECIEIFAPGSNIKSAWIGSPTATSTISGTSMASPHVAGAVAEYLSQYPTNTPKQIYDDIREMATADVVSNPGTGSPNLLLYRGCQE